MKLIKSLQLENATLREKLLSRSRRELRSRQYLEITAEIKSKLGNKYRDNIGTAIPYEFINKRRAQLNNRAFKSERLFLQTCVNNGLTNFHTNFPLLNRFYGDVVFFKDRVVVEVDEKYHRSEVQQKKDCRKDHWLRFFGWTVIRVDASTEANLLACALYLKTVLQHGTLDLEFVARNPEPDYLSDQKKITRGQMKRNKNKLLRKAKKKYAKLAKKAAKNYILRKA